MARVVEQNLDEELRLYLLQLSIQTQEHMEDSNGAYAVGMAMLTDESYVNQMGMVSRFITKQKKSHFG